mmetsp:Transcript_65423/g.210903  ORF Transcript_65423/g.210903 Transcript_65423/m.210903 type:complete len:203 (+) Transcript_65423:430-1038(+)
MIVEMRWAMQSTVCEANSLRIVSWISASVSTSTAEVASSSNRMRLERMSARARHICCRWPREKFCPCSATTASRPAASGPGWSPACASERAWTCAERWARRNACQRPSSSLSPRGSRLKRRLPEKSTGSWGMTVMLRRSRCRPRPAMSTPSMSTRPPSGSTMRSSTLSNDDLPAPVLPQMPSFSNGLTCKERPSSTNGSSDL